MKLYLKDHEVRIGSRKPIISGLDLELDGGGCWCLIGASGVGKTSFLLSLTQYGALRTASGEWQQAAYMTHREMVCAERLSVAKLLSLFDGDAMIDAWGLGGVRGHPVNSLSLGEKGRLSLALADAVSPEVLLLDEPNVGLDRTGKEFLSKFLARRSALGFITLLSTHDLTSLDMESYKMLYMRRDEEGVTTIRSVNSVIFGNAEINTESNERFFVEGSLISIAKNLIDLQDSKFL